MQIQDRNSSPQVTEVLNQVKDAIAASQDYLMSIQYPEGYWWAELESNVTITAEVVLLHKIWGTDKTRPLHKVETYLRRQQREHGGWELFYGDGGDLSTSVEAYMALRLLGVSIDDPALIRGREFILKRGGISKSRIFTKLHLALIGCYDWRGIPSIPPWIMLLPENFPFTIYEMSSWARSSTVPLLIVFDKKPVYCCDPTINLDELYSEGIENVKYDLPKTGDWTDIFVWLDGVFKFAQDYNLVPLRQESLQAAERWVLERQEDSGDWGGIIPAMLNSLLALRALNYEAVDPIVHRGLQSVDNFAIETEDTYHVQPCISPVWDTAWAIRALVESGLKADDPRLVKGAQWLLDKQILDYGDWAVKNKQGTPGGWAFEFDNRWYPDLDDSAVVVMALDQVKMPNEDLKNGAIRRCVRWMATMQCKDGGWGAFDLDNDQNWLNFLPYADLKAMIDPNTSDVTARVLEMLGTCGLIMDSNRVQKAIAYLEKEQEPDGSWFGRWGVNYIYGTSGVLSALAVIAPETHQKELKKGAAWLVGCQNADGGWGETCFSYNDSSLKGKGDSTASQTAWGLIGLLAAGEATGEFFKTAIERGVNYLLKTQREDGTWDENYFTGTGFPCHFYLKYHLYLQYFPLIALSRYQRLLT
ncbi:squalene/oxidosqualene cyclase [Gloeothece citriformis PCC 7424]|uniref:Squalene/oxidosqualene cyclase n=1 Tax=Gloeothece citriformis (strain PCC 7424) TaxID=65393 RepID=B7KE21_GLOC7|nr:squalene--hopene cyclase [Gloeothece citriformis]ACK71719.1 squalene/oxidosqualene cyclase [Gloeothece citriformis PCC 7424]